MMLSKVNKQLISDSPAGGHFWVALEQSLIYRAGLGTFSPASTERLTGLLIY